MKRFYLPLWRAIQGIFIGIGAMLPGISGGVMCVLFGIYRPMMELLSHPIRAFKKYWSLIAPVLVGWVGGFWIASALLAVLFADGQMQVYAVWLFIGLIGGTLPDLWKTATEKGITRSSVASLLICFALALVFFFTFRGGEETVNLPGGFLAWIFCGITWGISLIIPGLSSSALLMYLGLYQKMNAGVQALDFSVILPWLLGILLVVVFCTRGVNFLFEKAYAATYQGLFGVMVASSVAIIPYGKITVEVDGVDTLFDVVYNTETVLISLACVLIGFVVAIVMDRLGDKIVPKDEEEQA
ncbi:MAG: DUF368 domain-containing protein [Clostridia bacterium]|nr:DUF368 domain-containing protein [Clostridia bacterium]